MELDVKEALRYLGAGADASPQLAEQTHQCARQLTATLSPRYVYRVFPLMLQEEEILFSGTALRLSGRSARTMLGDCTHAALLCCTLGGEFDALMRRTQVRDMARAVILDACGSAWTEAGCDAAQEELSARFPQLYLTDRFSPGYGDLPLSLQGEICILLDVQRRLGVQCTQHFLLNPGKSVTAVIGLSPRPQMARIRGCEHCSMKQTCALRKGGTHCGI